MSTPTNSNAIGEESKRGSPSSPSSSVSFFLTGFGPFGGVQDNPTSAIIQTLKEKIANDDDTNDGKQMDSTTSAPLHLLENHTVHSLDIVHVSASKASQQVQDIVSTIRQNFTKEQSGPESALESQSKPQNQRNVPKQHVVILHLGVNHNQRQTPMFQLEQHAYNEANFRIPDQDGFQASKQPIDPSHPISHRLSTDLNVKRIRDRLKLKMKEYGYEQQADVGLSGDAGRFVCNYIYYQSLSHVEKLKEEIRTMSLLKEREGTTIGDDVEIHVMFIHVPSFEDISKNIQVEFTLELLDCVEEAIVAKDKKLRKKRNSKSNNNNAN